MLEFKHGKAHRCTANEHSRCCKVMLQTLMLASEAQSSTCDSCPEEPGTACTLDAAKWPHPHMRKVADQLHRDCRGLFCLPAHA